MLEIIFIIFLARKIGQVAKDKGLKPLGYQVLLVFLWFFGEFLFGVFGYVLFGESELACVAYLLAIIGALLGVGLAFLIVNSKKLDVLPAVHYQEPQPRASPERNYEVDPRQPMGIASSEGANLKISSGPLLGTVFPIHDGAQVGRGSACDVQLPDSSISFLQLVLRCAQGNWFLQDQASSGGTLVNGERVQATRLMPGDQITIGNTTMTFQEN